MRKIPFFSTLIIAILSLFVGAASVSAQSFNHSNQLPEPKIQVCNNNDCTLQWGLDAAEIALNGQITTDDVSTYAQNIVIYLLTFVSLIAVIYIIWAGFNVMIGNGDEKKLEDAKKTILYVALGMIMMWLAYSLVNFMMTFLNKTAHVENSKTQNYYAFNILPTANAQGFTENELGTFAEYKNRVQVAIEELETELRIEKKVSEANIAKVKSLVQAAFERLPDKDPEAFRVNDSAKRAVDMYLGLASKTPDSTQAVGEAISKVATFINNAKIEAIQGTISANPTSGNAPHTVSFLAQNVIDPSGTIPPANNYIWWIRENGGIRRELGRGPSLTQTFTNEGTYTVHLDVVSASRNSKGRADVLPLSTSVNIEVKPKIGEITLLVNGINVSNLSTLKISPTIAAQGLIFDATASRAIGNGKIIETKWNFGNGNTLQYKTSPSVERQIFATSWKFPVKLEFKTNDGQAFTKDIELIIIDPAATIKVDKTSTHVGEAMSFTAETALGDLRNVEYLWTVQDEDGKRNTKSSNGLAFSHAFGEIGSYIVTLTAKSPNGGVDTDSKIITVESRNPIATLDAPSAKNSEKPNVFTFDASRSYDADTNTRDGLTYSWRLNNQPVTLDPIEGTENGSKGTLTFENTGENTISVTVANKYGKIATAEQKFMVLSTLSGNLIITPQVAKVNDPVNFIAQSKNAQFFTWNMGDGNIKSGADRAFQHTYNKTGTYHVALTLQGNNPSETTTINRKVYVTDMDSPFGIITFQNASNSAIIEPGVCDGKDAYVLKRGESTTLSAMSSINVDGTPSNLDYTWRFMGKVSTLPTLSEVFKDLGCFPIQLTVKSKTSGASHTTTEYIKLQNQAPQLTNITTTVDASKKDSQKLIINATANGVSDPDGVITSYIWYYTTDSDKEPQGLQITQKPQMTFVLPNVSEKYHFGVIIEDNDGARVNSSEILQGQSPLIIDNENGNVHMPLITLTVPNKTIKVGQSVNFVAEAKTIMGTNITNKAQYSWDFDGDGRIDEKSASNSISHTYTKAGDYNVRVRVTNNGVTNTKYHSISVRNELKARVQGYKIPGDKLLLLNTSQGVYDKAKWTIGEFNSAQLESVVIDFDQVPQAGTGGSIGTLHISSNDTDISQTEIILRDLETVENSGSGIVYQSFPRAENDTITIKDPSESVKISMYGNSATNFAIDANLDLDGMGTNMDGISDNDIDNREHSSYTDGSVFIISDFDQATQRERKIKITTYNGTTPTATKIITIILDFVAERTVADENAFQNIDASLLTNFQKEKLEKLAEMIREMPDSARIVTMQEYNVLVENWESTFERAKNLVDIQLLVNEQAEVSNSVKEEISKTIDELLVGDAATTNAITVATTLVKNLLPQNSVNYNAMVEKIDAIASHPNDREANRTLGQELLVLIQQEPSENLSDNYKLIIRDQLKLIVSSGEDTSTTPTQNKDSNKSSGGFMGTLGTIGKIFLIILGIILGLGLIAFIYYRLTRKDENAGFQDYIIDKFNKEPKAETPAPVVQAVAPKPAEEKVAENIDPLKSYTPPVDPAPTADPLTTTNAEMPAWLKPQNESIANNSDPLGTNNSDPLATNNFANNSESSNNFTDNAGGLPDWLKPAGETTPSTQSSVNNEENIANNSDPLATNNSSNDGGLPDWLKPAGENSSGNFSEAGAPEAKAEENSINSNETSNGLPDWLSPASDSTSAAEEKIAKAEETPIVDNSSNNGDLPDWLKPTEETTVTSNSANNSEEKVAKIENNSDNEDLPDWLKPSTETTDNSSDDFSETETFEAQEESDSNRKNEFPAWMNSPSETEEKVAKSEEVPIAENSSHNGDLPDWLKSTEETTVTSNSANSTEEKVAKIEENSDNNDLPDWLKPSTETTDNIANTNFSTEIPLPEKIVESPSIKELEERMNQNNFSYTKSKEASATQTAVATDLPEWISDMAEEVNPPKAVEIETVETEIPAWMDNKTEAKTEIVAEETPIVNEKTIKKTVKKVTKTEKTSETKNADNSADSDIPEWLK